MTPLAQLDILGGLTPDLYFVLHLVQIGIFLALLRYLDLYEREPYRVIVPLFVWGALGAGLLAGPLNGLVSRRLPPDVDLVFGAALSAPLMEELVKGVALVVGVAFIRWYERRFRSLNFEGVNDGIIYGAAVGLGFAFTENIFFFLRFAELGGSFDVGLEVFLLRVDFTGVQSLLHPAWTGIFGAGVGLAAVSRRWGPRIGYPLLGFVIAAILHAAWNGLPQLLVVSEFGLETVVAWFGAGVPAPLAAELEVAFDGGRAISRWLVYVTLIAVAGGFAAWLRYERQIIRFELAEEVQSGLLSASEWELLPRFRQRQRQYLRLFLAGRVTLKRALRDRHDKLVELALVKWRSRRTGDEWEVVALLRADVSAHGQYVRALEEAHGIPSGPTTRS